MTIKEAIDRLDALMPNTYTEAEKIAWLSALDGLVYDRVLSTHEGGPESFSPYDTSTARTTVLLVPAPYDDVYLFFMQARILYFNGEIRRQNNASRLFDELFDAFRDRYNATHAPLGCDRRLGG